MMGIVVTLGMLLGLIGLLTRSSAGHQRPIAILVIALGLWNLLWYGMQHLETFWGQAAALSGMAMLSAGTLMLSDQLSTSYVQPFTSLLKPLRWLVFVVLLLCFLLYAVTLVRLNLGLSVIR